MLKIRAGGSKIQIRFTFLRTIFWAPKQYKNRPHIVKKGESMYIISQKYGIRLKNLYKMNYFDIDHQIKIGDRIRIR